MLDSFVSLFFVSDRFVLPLLPNLRANRDVIALAQPPDYPHHRPFKIKNQA